jgi:tetratricopeptide (TPR) repeat protein
VKIILKSFLALALALGFAMQTHAQEASATKTRKSKNAEFNTNRLFIEGQRYLIQEDLDKAYFYFQKARDLSPDQGAINFKIAEILLRANKTDQAMGYGMKAVAADPSNKYYNLMMAEVYSKKNQPKKAAEILESLMSNSEENQNYIIDLASLYLTANDFDNALKALDRAEEYYGIVEQFTVQKQRIYLRKNDLKSAIREGEKLIASSPGNSQYVLNLVEILFNNGRTAEAIATVESSLLNYPNQPDLQLAAYALYKEKGDVDTAEDLISAAFDNPDLEGQVKAQAFADILQEPKTQRRERLLANLEAAMVLHHPNDPDILTVLGDRRLFEGNKVEALNLYKKSLQLNPSNSQVLQGVITIMFEVEKDHLETEKYTVMAVDEFPDKAEFWFFDGTVKSLLKKGEEAEESLLKAIEINKGKNKAFELAISGQLGDTYHMSGKKEAAYAQYDKVLQAKPDDEHVLNNYAYFLSLDKKDLDKAKSMSEQLVKRFPKNATFLDTHAWVLFQRGEYESAKIFMERALENEANPSGIMFEHFGDILYHLGKKSEAVQYWKKAEGGEDTTSVLTRKIKDQKYYE